MKKKTVFAVLFILVAAGIFLGWKFFGPTTKTSSGEFFYVRTGSSYNDVRKELVEKKYLSGTQWFDLTSKMLGYKSVKPGRYKITKGMSLYKLVKMLKNGQQTPVSFVISKVRTKEGLAGRIGTAFECDSLSVIAFLNNSDSLKKYGLDTTTVMAAAMPYTYTLNWNSSVSKVFQQFYNAWEKFWTPERKQKADSLQLTPVEISTLASIIEEETNKKADKLNIASTYLNRVRTGMKLQADPTVKFALRDFALKRVTGVHLRTVSPYNTYLNAGLPPGPICTPSLESLDAVLFAPPTDYLYFVASHKFDGTSLFSSNYEDHQKLAKLYQNELTRRMDSAKKARTQ